MSKENIIFAATDPEGRNIILYDEVWSHIKHQHREILSHSKIRNTIQKPDIITKDTSRKSLVYTTSVSFMPPNFNVFAEMDDEYKSGRVTTAFLDRRKMPSGEIIWTDST